MIGKYERRLHVLVTADILALRTCNCLFILFGLFMAMIPN
jgi:hypothetical protein